jgi:hypothetical protein
VGIRTGRGMGDEAKYHTDRAMAEIELAGRAPSLEAARAHLSLSALHLDRLRGLAQPQRASLPPDRTL